MNAVQRVGAARWKVRVLGDWVEVSEGPGGLLVAQGAGVKARRAMDAVAAVRGRA